MPRRRDPLSPRRLLEPGKVYDQRLEVLVDQELREALRHYAAEQRISEAAAVRAALTRHLGESHTTQLEMATA
jgi:predicted HicB family RNase H-like nuclease